jgi:protein phosphatase
MFVAGVTAILFDRPLQGLFFVALAAFGGVGAFAYWLEKRPKRKPVFGGEGDSAETSVWKAYRSASARPSVAFLNHLANLEGELQRAATEERWSIDWAAHETAFTAAKKALHEQAYPAALAELAKAFDVLMAGLLQYRRQLQRQAKWGRPTTPPPLEKSEG